MDGQMKLNPEQNDPSQPDYWTEARDAILSLCPFYDPHHECNIVRENVFFDVVAELNKRVYVLKLENKNQARVIALLEAELTLSK
jgi:hypothetical protein